MSSIWQILRVLRRRMTWISPYKPTTLKRGLSAEWYCNRSTRGRVPGILHDHQAEVEALYQDMLIHGVTSFFRDPSTFATPDEICRVW